MSLTKEDVRGRWDIVEWVQRYDDGRETYPLGRNLEGFVYYGDPDMVIMVSGGERPNFITGGQWNASDREKAAAYDSFLTYAGRYEVDAEFIRHHVDICLFPNWVGGVQRRRASIIDGQLHLVARLEEGTSEARSATLIWRRPKTPG